MTDQIDSTLEDGANFAAALRMFIEVAANKGLTPESLYVALIITAEHFFPNDIDRFVDGLRDCSKSRDLQEGSSTVQ